MCEARMSFRRIPAARVLRTNVCDEGLLKGRKLTEGKKKKSGYYFTNPILLSLRRCFLVMIERMK
jgi:hypothetical protein